MTDAEWPRLSGEWIVANSIDCTVPDADDQPSWAERAEKAAPLPSTTVPKHIVQTPCPDAKKSEDTHAIASAGLGLLQAALAKPADDDDDATDIDPKSLARQQYHRQSRRGGGHTMKARWLDMQSANKQHEVEVISGANNPAVVNALKRGEVSAPDVAIAFGGTCKLVKGYMAGVSIDVPSAVRQGHAVYSVTIPERAGDGTTTILVDEQRGRPPTRTAHRHDKIRAYSPDYYYARQIHLSKTKDEVNRQEIRTGMALAAALR